MSSFWQHLFNSELKRSSLLIPIKFPEYADKSIQLITKSDGQLLDEQLINVFTANSIPHSEAIELLLFLPTAFCRHMLPQIKWPAYYIEQLVGNKMTEIRYADNLRYIAIEDALKRYLNGIFTQDDYLKIATRDASFKSINQLLLGGGRLENVSVSPEVIMR